MPHTAHWNIARVMLLMIMAAMWAAPQEPSDADQAFAQKLSALPDNEAHGLLAHADSSQITAGLAKALVIIGNAYYSKQHDLVADIRVERLAAEVATRGNFSAFLVSAHNNIALALLNMGKLDEALENSDLAIGILPAASDRDGVLKFAAVLLVHSAINRQLGDYQAALSDSAQAIENYRKMGEEVGLARALNGHALTLVDMGDYGKAAAAFRQGLEIAERRGEVLGQAYIWTNLANLCVNQGDYNLAASYAQKSLKLKQAAGDLVETGSSLANLGAVYHALGRDAEAAQAFRQAIRIATDGGRKSVAASALGQLGRLEFDRKDYTTALQHLRETLRLNEEIGEPVDGARTLGQLADVQFAAGDVAEALRSALRARDIAREHGAVPELLLPSLVAGRAHRTLGQTTEARAAFEEAIGSVERTRALVAGGELSREVFLAERSAPYREMTALNVEEGRVDAAIVMIERAKARTLLDLSGGGRPGIEQAMTGVERDRELAIKRKLASLSAQLRSAALANPPPRASLKDLENRVEAARAESDNFRLVLYSAHPDLALSRGDAQPIGSGELAGLPADDRTAVLEYAVTPRGVYLFSLTRGQPPRVYRLPEPEMLRRQSNDFLTRLGTRDPDFGDLSEKLYRELIAPARKELAGKSTLIIVPDGELWQIPFAALRNSDGRFLAQDTAIFYAPSLSLLQALRKRRRPAAPTLTLAAFANPTGDWAESEDQVRQLVALYGSASSRLWLGPAATEEAFRRESSSFDVIQVAAHGLFDDRNPMRSHLVFGTPKQASVEDGLLDAGEIRGLRLKAALVVLAGCQTARGNFEDGEGVIGMTWAFLAAGSHAVVASQWRVEAGSTGEFMLQFHRTLRQGTAPAQALRQASLGLMRSQRFSHPFYWAGFALFGDGN